MPSGDFGSYSVCVSRWGDSPRAQRFRNAPQNGVREMVKRLYPRVVTSRIIREGYPVMNDKEFQYKVKQIVEQNYIKEFWCETCKCECFFIRVTQYNIDDVYRCMGCLSLCDVKPVASPYNDLRTKNVKASEEFEAKRKAEQSAEEAQE